MAALAITGIAAVVLTQGTPDASMGAAHREQGGDVEAAASAQAGDPILGRFAGGAERHPSLLYGHVRSEPREPEWAPRAEAALKARYESLVNSGRVEDLRVLCASTICEVAGAIVGKNPDGINSTMREIQNRELAEPLAQTGLTNQSAMFGSRPNSRQAVFATYWLRTAS